MTEKITELVMELVKRWWRNLDYDRKVEVSEDYFPGDDDLWEEWFNLSDKQKLRIYKPENR